MENVSSLLNQTSMTIKSLEEHNASRATQRLPTIIFLSILTVLGIFGNSIVLLVYGFKYSPSTFRFFILSLGVLDMLSCTIAIPLEIADNVYPVMFYNEGICKTGRFFGNVFKIGSAFVLMVMAAGRYWRICRPFSSQMTLSQARYCITLAIVLAVLLSWPNAIIQGIKELNFAGNITGYDCSIDDAVRNTEYPFIYSTVLFVVYLATFITLSILYTLIIFELKKHAKRQMSLRLNDKVKKMNPRITKVMMAITVAFILCYLPNCILDAGTTFKRDYLFPASPLVLGLLPVLSRTFFINNVMNPLIYVIAETKFRDVCRQKLYMFCHIICPCLSINTEKVFQSEDIHLTDVKSNETD